GPGGARAMAVVTLERTAAHVAHGQPSGALRARPYAGGDPAPRRATRHPVAARLLVEQRLRRTRAAVRRGLAESTPPGHGERARSRVRRGPASVRRASTSGSRSGLGSGPAVAPRRRA